MACASNCSCDLCAVLGMGGPPVRGEFLPDTSRVLGGRSATPSVGGDRGMVLGIGTSAWPGGLWDDLGGALWPAADAQGPMPPPLGGGALGLGGFELAWERCSEEDEFVVREFGPDGSWPVVTVANFQGYWPAMVATGAAIADTTVQRTTEAAYGRSSPFGRVTTYPIGSLRMYLSARTDNLTAEEYTLLSTNGIDFEMEVGAVGGRLPFAERRPGLPLGTGVGQAESYIDHVGNVSMYYNGGDGIYVKTSPDGLEFGAAQFTGLDEATVGWPGLTGLSVVKIGPGSYRGYFGNELYVADSDAAVFAATSSDKVSWTPEPSGGNVGPNGEVIGRGSNSGPLAVSGARQPFALKRNDPSHPACVTLFYYRPPADARGTRLYYSTALDGITFGAEFSLELRAADPSQGFAGPTLVNVNGLSGWVEDADPPIYLLYVDTGNAVSGFFTAAYSLQRAP